MRKGPKGPPPRLVGCSPTENNLHKKKIALFQDTATSLGLLLNPSSSRGIRALQLASSPHRFTPFPIFNFRFPGQRRETLKPERTTDGELVRQRATTAGGAGSASL
ncbi:hypothetical protein SLEP1_g19441 [Rubroshorea leprosula]|uniref:Uncharacterized protein n=1 Tax=Rubroshorea leprosula TaxID=152421 RepID=A0AAV5IZC2_9ROSI|nr:hypothetical protein SLEP1_g19441 [Rubroshorea leprosula]